MELIFKNREGDIIDGNNWESSWMPKKKEHWKDGRSSKELARFASNKTFSSLISEVVESCIIAEQNFKCTPEAKSSLGNGFGRGGCRNHDLLMEGDKDCIIGVEAKVDELFDNDWKVELNEQKKKQNDNETKTRAYKLKNYLVKDENHNIDKIGYQLFTTTRATINCAIEKGKNKCIVLVIVFKGEIEKDNQHENKVAKNNKDFIEFCKAIGVQDEKINIDGIECWIKKMTVKILKDNSDIFTYEIKNTNDI